LSLSGRRTHHVVGALDPLILFSLSEGAEIVKHSKSEREGEREREREKEIE